MSDTTSSTQGATPTVDTGATPTPATPASATPQTATLTTEELSKRIADLERSLNNAKEENTRHSKRLTAYEKQEQERLAAEQAAKDAEKSELERIREKHQEAEVRLKQLQQENIVEKVMNAAYKKGIVDPELAALAILQNKEGLDENGMPTDLDKALDALIKSKPYLKPETAAAPAPTPAQSAPTPATPAIPAMNPGRSSIPGPGGNPTGKPTTLADIQWRR